MSAEDTVSDAAGAISADRFVEISYDEVIPNNVALGSDKQLQRALEGWRPKYLDWWTGMGPVGFQQSEVYLRTAVGVDPAGWAKFGYVKMPTYRWGILLAPKVEGRTIPFGRHKGEPAWQEVPGEHRALLRRLIVVQGDTEPASVEQQRFLGATAPSLYDMRNLFQVNVEEGRHLWAMVYLLVKYFGKDGREEAQALLERQSGQMDNPRILGAFNESTPDWLSFFMFTFFTDRDGKMQLAALAESGFDPLSRTCRFMLTEEAHHMFVGETGVQRTIEATCAAMVKAGIKDPNDVEAVRKLGVVDLPLLQRKRTSTLRSPATCSAAKSPATPPRSSAPASRAASTRRTSRATITCCRTRPIPSRASSTASSSSKRRRRCAPSTRGCSTISSSIARAGSTAGTSRSKRPESTSNSSSRTKASIAGSASSGANASARPARS